MLFSLAKKTSPGLSALKSTMKLRTPGTFSDAWSLFFLFSLLCTPKISNAVDTLSLSDMLKVGDTIISSNGTFEMGFFSPPNSKNTYLGIWYKRIPSKTVVWVANRETPLTNSSGILNLVKPGMLVILNDSHHTIWSTSPSRNVQNPLAQLLDSGNLVIKDANDHSRPENFIWQSFDYPTDTLLPEMKIGINFETGREAYLSSWKSADDPAPGEFTYHCDPSGYPQNFIKGRNSVVRYRSGPWIGNRFSGSSNSRNSPIYSIDLVSNEKGVYFTSHSTSSVITRYVLDQSGIVQRWMWVDRTQNWLLYLTTPDDNCDSFQLCGPNGICRIQRSPFCDCLDRFVPKFPSNWLLADWSSGCVRRTPLDCKKGDVFLKYASVKLPDTRKSWYNGSMTLEECRLRCLKDCSCMAYANSNILNGGSGCLLWFQELIDIKEVGDGQDIYIRMASSELDSIKKRGILKVILPVSLGALLLGLLLVLYLLRWKRKPQKLKYDGRKVHGCRKDRRNQNHDNDFELVMFELAAITKATDDFSLHKKLGEGGYGPVYKGVLDTGQEIAVKRLSKTSHQGPDEFKNELEYIAKLQHRNLVRLLGCCIEGEEKMLIYEYMHNKSLDSFIFDGSLTSKYTDQTGERSLDWPTRFHIILGIARGLLYLHDDSRLRIVHRDLKASNILLDVDMNPKISDFGIARSFKGNDTEAKTNRLIGTYGYISPEYATHGHFSVKSDVFSFGVLVLEIVSGKRNSGFVHPDHSYNLLGHAWVLYKEGRALELVAADLGYAYHSHEVLRSIHVALLCVQQNPEDRLKMFRAVLMLSNGGDLPMPKQPGFFLETIRHIGESSARPHVTSASEYASITVLQPR